MKFCFFLSTKGGSPLQIGMERGLRELEHQVSYYPDGKDNADILLVWNQCAHDVNYVYPELPLDWNRPLAFIDSAEFGPMTRLPGRCMEYANTFSVGAMAHDTKNLNEQIRLRRFLDGRSFPYFIREFHKDIQFPANYHKIDYPLYAGSACYIRPNREEYLRRPRDLFVSWGASHPWRWDLTKVLRKASPHSEIHVLEEVVGGKTTPRMNQLEYFNKTREAKCSVSFDGYGSGSFRVCEVLVRTVLLQGPMTMLCRAPLVDGETCVMYDVQSDGENYFGTNIEHKLAEVLENPERSYEIYERGYDHCMTHLTEKATAQYVIETIANHDWLKPTQLDI